MTKIAVVHGGMVHWSSVVDRDGMVDRSPMVFMRVAAVMVPVESILVVEILRLGLLIIGV